MSRIFILFNCEDAYKFVARTVDVIFFFFINFLTGKRRIKEESMLIL